MEVKPVAVGLFWVESETKSGLGYLVFVSSEKFWCECRFFVLRGLECKHLKVVKSFGVSL